MPHNTRIHDVPTVGCGCVCRNSIHQRRGVVVVMCMVCIGMVELMECTAMAECMVCTGMVV